MSKAKLPIRFINGNYQIKNKTIEIEVEGPGEELGKELGIELSSYLMETFDRIVQAKTPSEMPAGAKGTKLAKYAEVGGNILFVAEILSDVAFLVTDIVEAVRSANTTSFIFVNAIPNSTLRISSINQTDGSWVEVSEATMKQDKAKTNFTEATALVYNSQPYRSGGLQKGSLNLRIELPDNKVENIKFVWDNPLGVDTKRKKATYGTDQQWGNPNQSYVMANVSSSHSDKTGKKRHDIVTVLLLPTARCLQLSQLQVI